MGGLKLRLFGTFEARTADGQKIEIATKKARALLAYLALQPGRRAARDKLASLLWANHDENRASGSLRQTLTILRKYLAHLDSSPLKVDRSAISMDPAVEIDVATFRDLASSDDPTDLERAVSLCFGELAEDLSVREPEFESWLEEERRDLRAQLARALLELMAHKCDRGAPEAAIEFGQRLLRLDPLSEQAHRALMTAYRKSGQRQSALQQYQICRTALEQELGILPEQETTALYEAIGEDRGNTPAEVAVPGAQACNEGTGEPLEPPLSVRENILLSRRLPRWAIVAAVVVAAASSIIALLPTVLTDDENDALVSQGPSADPSIAVLPFDNLSPDPENAYFSDGFTNDIITELAKNDGLLVLSSNSSFAFRNKAVNVRLVAAELGVRYVLEGSIQKSDDRVRINAQLIDARTGMHLWAERFDRPFADIFAVQNEVTSAIATSLAVRISNREAEHRVQAETSDPRAYDALLRGRQHLHAYTPEDYAIALLHLKKALQYDPGYGRAHALLAIVYWESVNNTWERAVGISVDDAWAKTEYHLNVAMKNPTPEALFLASKIASNDGRYDEAIALSEQMLRIDPNYMGGYAALGRALNKAGRFADGLVALQSGARLDPKGEEWGWYAYRMGESYYHLGHFGEAAERFLTYTLRYPQEEWGYLYLAATRAQLGEMDKANEALDTFEAIRTAAGHDQYTIAATEGWTFKFESDRRLLQEGLRKAGLPEGNATPGIDQSLREESPETIAGATIIEAASARLLADRGVPIIDLRETKNWEAGHVPGAVHMELYNHLDEQRLSQIVGKDDEVVFYCDGPASPRGARGVSRAVFWGYKRVYFFRDGFPAWKSAGYPVIAAVMSGAE